MSRALPLVVATWLLASCQSMMPTSRPADVVRGPLAVGTNGPVAATLMQFRPRAARVLPAGEALVSNTLAYSSMFENGTGSSSKVVLDGEIARDTVALRAGVGGDTDVEVQVPFVFASNGFLDDLVETWHDTFGFPNGGREKRPKNDYEMRIEKDGRRIYALDRGRVELGDVPVFVTRQLLDEERDGVGLALCAGIEFPLGSESRGVGNGGFDGGGGVILERSLDRFTLTAGAYHVLASTPDSFRPARVEIQDQDYLHGGLECRWNDVSSLVLGLRWSSAVTRDIEIQEVDGSVLELDVGFAVDDGFLGGRVAFGLSEDIIAESGPDWTAFLAWSRSL